MNSSNLSFDRDYEADQRKHATVLMKERDKLLLALDAYESTKGVKIDAKIDKSIKYYRDRITEADAKLEKDIKDAREAHSKNVNYCQSELQRLEEGRTASDPERITLMKMRLRKLEHSITTKEILLNFFEVAKKPDYIPKVVLPEKVWEPSEEALEQEKELLKMKQLARLDDASKIE